MASREDLKEKFRQLLVPLLHMGWHDNPTDITMYCSRYFQVLLEEREKNSISGNKNEESQQKQLMTTGKKATRREPVSQVQESTSLPILTNVCRDGLSIRETSSWNSPSDTSSMPRRFWHLSYDVADAMSSIGDQPNRDNLDIENCKAEGIGNQVFGEDERSKVKKNDSKNYERNSESCTSKLSESSLIDGYAESTFDNEVEEEVSAIINVSPLADVTPQSTYRKKWSTSVDPKIRLELEHGCLENNSDIEVATQVGSPKNETVNSLENNFPNASLGFIPQLKELASLVNVKGNALPIIQKDIAISVKSLSQSLQELIKVLDSVKSFCNENLQKVKVFSEELPVKPLAAPRKKRSVTTFSSSDNVFQTVESLRRLGNKSPSSGTDKDSSKMSRKFLESGKECYESKLDALVSDHSLKGKRNGENHEKIEMDKNIEGSNSGRSNDSCSKKNSSLDLKKMMKDTNIKEVKRTNSKEIATNDKPQINGGIVNKGFVKDDSELYRKSPFQIQRMGENSRNDNGHRRLMLDESRAFSEIRIPNQCSRRMVNFTRHYGQMNRQMARFQSGYGFRPIGEGGDMFGISQRQCSVGTETEPSQMTDRPGNFNERIRAIRNNPSVDESTLQEASPFKKVNGKIGSLVTEKEPTTHKSSLCHDKNSKFSEDSSIKRGTNNKDEKETTQEIKINLKTKKSSSLNPCAESFNPKSKLIQDLIASECLGKRETIKMEDSGSDSANFPVDQSTISFPEVDADEFWDYEMFENDFLQQDLEDIEPILYQNGDSDENAPLSLLEETEDYNNVPSSFLEEVEDYKNLETEAYTTVRELLDPIGYPYGENGIPHSQESAYSPTEKNSENLKTEDKKRQSDTKLAEGDQNSEDTEDRAERCDSAEKQEPGLNSACGDFVVAGNNDDVEDNSDDASGNDQMVIAPGSVAFGMRIPGLLPNLVEDSDASQNRLQEEEELNFSCFSGSDSSEVDSSDISVEENEFSGENDETKLEEKV